VQCVCRSSRRPSVTSKKALLGREASQLEFHRVCFPKHCHGWPCARAGFLFLGAGNATFGTSNSAIAALLIALHPRLPLNMLDNSCHLQVRVGRACAACRRVSGSSRPLHTCVHALCPCACMACVAASRQLNLCAWWSALEQTGKGSWTASFPPVKL